jgi:hypothetical protein
MGSPSKALRAKRKEVNKMEYSKPELVLTGQAESLVLGAGSGNNDPSVTFNPSFSSSVLEFED